MYWNAGRLKEIPLRLFHGEKDTTVYPEESRRMAEKITESGGTVTLTVYPDCDHDCWSRAFDDAETMKWLLQQKKKKNDKIQFKRRYHRFNAAMEGRKISGRQTESAR